MKSHILIGVLWLFMLEGYSQNKAIGILKYSQITAFIDTTKQSLTPVSMYFNQYESITKGELIQKMNKSDSIRIAKTPNGEKLRFSVYVNLIKQEMRSRQRANTELVMVRDTLERIDWKIFPIIRKIGSLNCQKAQAVVRGRTYPAWFAPEIPLSFGPWKLQGLPGLIVEAKSSDNQVEFRFESLQFPITDTILIEPLEPFGKMKTVNEHQFLALKRQNDANFQKMLESQPDYVKGDKVTSTWIELYADDK